jgi:hypothetical protein
VRATKAPILAAACILLLAGCGGSSKQPPHTGTAKTTATVPRIPVKAKPEGTGVLAQATISYPMGPASLQAAPSVTPAVGSTTTVFALHVHVRSPLGPHGRYFRDYRVLLTGIRPRCAVFTDFYAATVGARATIELRPPLELGWCRGPYHGRVLLQTSSSCPPRTSTNAPACLTLPTRDEVVGRFGFVAR